MPSAPGAPARPRVNPIQPAKLLRSKWTAAVPVAREKHFLVTRVIEPEDPAKRLEWIEIEAVHSGRVRRIAWRELRDPSVWRQGWV
jgi:tryptophan-rich hypothetical protein